MLLKNLKIIMFCMAASAVANAQSDNNPPKDNSPYSRYGLGDLSDQNNAASEAMGGLSATYHDIFHLNVQNPASFSFLKSTAFEVGLYGKYAQLKKGNTTGEVWSGNLRYMALGFPLTNPINEILNRRRPSNYAWGMGFSLLPFSTVGYDVQSTNYLPGIGNYTYRYFGKGGTYKVQWSNSVKYKDLAFGANLGYFFGKSTNERDVYFNDFDNSYLDNLVDNTSVGGVTWNAGVLYDHNFKKKNDAGEIVNNGKRITFGVHGNSATSFRTNSDKLYKRVNTKYIANSTGLSITDTILVANEARGNGKLPFEISAGIGYEVVNKFRLAANYSFGAWSGYRNDAKPETLKNGWRASVGGEYTPDYISYNSYLKRIHYRFGAFYTQDPRVYANQQLTNYGITFGFGLPIVLPRQQTSFVNLSFEIGKQGIPNELQSTYGKMTVGFTLNDNSWFYKQKFK